MSSLKAILFDIGGVVVRSPMIAIASHEQLHGIPANYINHAISRSGPSGAWSSVERGDIKVDSGFFGGFSSDLGSSEHWESFHMERGLSVPEQRPQIDGEKLFWEMMAKAREPDPIVLRAIRKLRATGRFTLGALTNDYQHPPGHPYADNSAIRDLFDVFVASSETGMRKPEERFYQLALQRLGVQSAHEVVFLDDIGSNLKAARKLGFHTIRVKVGESSEAINELERLTGETLLEENPSKL